MKKRGLIKNKIIKNILSALAVAVFGFILLNVAFLFDFLFQSLLLGFFGIFVPIDLTDSNFSGVPPIMHILFIGLIGLISWFVFKSKLKVIYKAVYMTVPLAVVFVTIGMFFYQWPIVGYLLGILFGISVLYYFYRTKQPWIYYYTLILISFIMLIVGLFGVEI